MPAFVVAAALPGCASWDPVCNAASSVAGATVTAASDAALSGLGGSFLVAAEQATALALSALDSSTAVDLSVSWFRSNVAVIAAVTLPMVVGLLVAQVVGSVIRREPGGLARAVVGVGKAMLGAALALALTQLALTAVDAICEVIASAAGMTVASAAARFLNVAAYAATSPAPVWSMLIGLAVVVGCVLLWGVMLFRKAALILVAVFAPVAFAGQVWDATRVWTRRWLEVVAALVLCKVVIVVVFVVGASAFTGIGPGENPTQAAQVDASGVAGLSDLLVGLLLLGIAVFAPWLTWRFVHWSGMEAAAVMHSAVAANPLTSSVRGAGVQARHLGQQVLTSLALGGAGGAGRAAGGAAARSGGGAVPRLQAPPARPAGGGGAS